MKSSKLGSPSLPIACALAVLTLVSSTSSTARAQQCTTPVDSRHTIDQVAVPLDSGIWETASKMCPPIPWFGGARGTFGIQYSKEIRDDNTRRGCDTEARHGVKHTGTLDLCGLQLSASYNEEEVSTQARCSRCSVSGVTPSLLCGDLRASSNKMSSGGEATVGVNVKWDFSPWVSVSFAGNIGWKVSNEQQTSWDYNTICSPQYPRSCTSTRRKAGPLGGLSGTVTITLGRYFKFRGQAKFTHSGGYTESMQRGHLYSPDGEGANPGCPDESSNEFYYEAKLCFSGGAGAAGGGYGLNAGRQYCPIDYSTRL